MRTLGAGLVGAGRAMMLLRMVMVEMVCAAVGGVFGVCCRFDGGGFGFGQVVGGMVVGADGDCGRQVVGVPVNRIRN